MRYIRSRKRLKWLVILVVLCNGVLFLEARCQGLSFSRTYIEGMRAMRGTITHAAPVSYLKSFFRRSHLIAGPEGSAAPAPSVPHAWLRDALTKMSAYRALIALIPEPTTVTVDFRSADGSVEGNAYFSGNGDRAEVKGLIAFKEEKISFFGTIYARRGIVSLTFSYGQGNARVKVFISKTGAIKARILLNKLIACGRRFSGTIECSGYPVRDAGDAGGVRFDGELAAGDLKIDDIAIMAVRCVFSLNEKRFLVSSFTFGSDIRAKGVLGLVPPYDIDAVIAIAKTHSRKLLYFTDSAAGDMPLAGEIEIVGAVKGRLDKPVVDLFLKMSDGRLSEIDFKTLEARLKGVWPVVRIDESRISRRSGYFALCGEIDLSRLGKSGCFRGLDIITDESAILWDALDTRKTQAVQSVEMKKRLNDDLDFGFKRFMREYGIDESLREQDEFEIEYKLKPNESLKITVGDTSNFVGFEHKDRF